MNHQDGRRQPRGALRAHHRDQTETPGKETMNPTRVVLDCDTANEVDDQFAIAHALGAPEGTLEVRGVGSVHNTTAHGPRAGLARYVPGGGRACGRLVRERRALYPRRGAPDGEQGGSGAERWPRVPRGRGAPGTANHHRHGIGNRPSLPVSGRAGDAGETCASSGSEDSGTKAATEFGRTGWESSTAKPTARPGVRYSKDPWISYRFPRGPRRRRYW